MFWWTKFIQPSCGLPQQRRYPSVHLCKGCFRLWKYQRESMCLPPITMTADLRFLYNMIGTRNAAVKQLEQSWFFLFDTYNDCGGNVGNTMDGRSWTARVMLLQHILVNISSRIALIVLRTFFAFEEGADTKYRGEIRCKPSKRVVHIPGNITTHTYARENKLWYRFFCRASGTGTNGLANARYHWKKRFLTLVVWRDDIWISCETVNSKHVACSQNDRLYSIDCPSARYYVRTTGSWRIRGCW